MNLVKLMIYPLIPNPHLNPHNPKMIAWMRVYQRQAPTATSLTPCADAAEVPDLVGVPAMDPAEATQQSDLPRSQIEETTLCNTGHQRPLMPIYTKAEWVKLQDSDIVLHHVMQLITSGQIDTLPDKSEIPEVEKLRKE